MQACTLILTFILAVYSANTFSSELSYKDFREETTVRDMELSPNGRLMATLWSKDGVRTVVVKDIVKNKVVTTFGDPVIRPSNIHWANNEKLIVNIHVPVFSNHVRKQIKKGKDISEIDSPSVYRAVAVTPGKKGYVELLGDKQSLTFNYHLGRLHHILPSKSEVVQLTAFHKGALTLYDSNIYTGKTRLHARGGKLTYAFGSNIDGKLLYRFDYLPDTKAIQVYDFTQDKKWKKKERIYFNRDSDSFRSVNYEDFFGLLNDGSLIYKKLNQTTGFYELHTRNSAGITSLYASRSDSDILYLAKKSDTREVIGYGVAKNDVLREIYFKPELQAESDLIEQALSKVGISSFSIRIRNDDANLFVIYTSGADNPGAYFIYSRDEKRLAFSGFANPLLPAEKLGISAVTQYQARDNTPIPALILLPPNYKKAERYPTIIMPHGGPHVREYAYFDLFAQFLATRGYIIIKPNFRGSTGFGKAFEEAGHKQWGQLMQDDIEDAAAFAIRKGLAKPGKICMLGISFGGYASLMAAINKDSLFQCSVSINGVTDIPHQLSFFKNKFKNSSTYEFAMDRIYNRIGHSKKDRKMLNHNSPVNRAKEMKIPILIIGGQKDSIVPYKQQTMMRSALKRAKKEFEFIKLEDSGHGPVYSYRDINIVYPAVEKFLAKYLQ